MEVNDDDKKIEDQFFQEEEEDLENSSFSETIAHNVRNTI